VEVKSKSCRAAIQTQQTVSYSRVPSAAFLLLRNLDDFQAQNIALQNINADIMLSTQGSEVALISGCLIIRMTYGA